MTNEEQAQAEEILESMGLVPDDTEAPGYVDSSGNEYNDFKNSEIRELNSK